MEGTRMKSIRYAAVALLVLTLTLPARGWDAAAAHDRGGLQSFVAAAVDRTSAPPFSFIYGGKLSSGFIGKWAVTVDALQAPGRTVKTVVYSDPATRPR
jgi:hypothetical protein